MKPRTSIISLLLAMVMVILPSTAVLAAAPQPFSANGTVSENISFGNPAALGNSGRWLVPERSVSGTFLPGNSIAGDFAMVYRANVNEYQAGNFQGNITVGDYTINVNGKSAAMEYVPVPTPYGILNLPKIAVSGNWNFADGAKGNGTLQAVIIFMPYVDEYGQVHVAQILPGSFFSMTGKWQP